MAKSKPANKKIPKTKTDNLRQKLEKNKIPIILSIILFILVFTTYQVFIWDRFYPFTSVGNTNISFLSKTSAIQKVKQNIAKRSTQDIQFNSYRGEFNLRLSKVEINTDYSPIEEFFNKIHQDSFSNQLIKQLFILINPQQIQPKITLDLENQFDEISKIVNKEAQNAKLSFSETPEASPSFQVQIKEAEYGLQLNKKRLEETIVNFLLTGKYDNNLPLENSTPKVSTEEIKQAQKALELSQKQTIQLKFNGNIWVLDTKQLITLLDLTEGEGLLDKEKAHTFIEKIAKEINVEVKEGLFEFNSSTGKVAQFRPSTQGQRLDIDKTYQLLTQATLSENNRDVDLPVEIIAPKIQTQDVNNLGIKELIGRGVSHFAGSIPNRIYNVGLTAQKINGVLVPPGEIFSFNRTIGDISAATGFKQAYVIKEGRTVLDDGGGVCQDSTTLFRAVLNAGLPVIKRTAHAYRVGYYEQGFPPGLDATVFYPSVDFQFKNDTQNHILIQAYTSGTTLYIDLYGTSDGRMVTLSKPSITNQTPPPPELRQDDPTLPKGTVKQVDWAAPGATVSFNRTVTKNGEEIIKETWKSNYKAWQAVYLVGTQ